MKIGILVLTASFAVSAVAQVSTGTRVNTDGFTNTPIIPGTQWHVHDPNRTQPPIVKHGTFSTQEQPGKPPSDAIVLFDGTDLSKWRNKDGQAPVWKVEDGAVTAGKGDIFSREEFGDVQLHLEFATPPPKGNGQGRGNSGVFLMGRYELQILDCYDNLTYADGTIGAMYGQHPPLANVSRAPGEWQVYDLVFNAPRFKADGSVESPAYMTAFLNGVLVQNHESYNGPTGWKQFGKYSPHPPTGPISLQDHGNPMRFRNIWVRPLKQPAP
jgi:hypothetical protein